MPAELQPLIDRIREEAVVKAEQQAEEVIAQAHFKATSILKEAEARARRLLEQADSDADAFAERSKRTLELAARDVLISVGQGVENILSDLIAEEVDRSLNGDVLIGLLGTIVEAYLARDGKEHRLDILLSPEDQEDLTRFFKQRYADKLAGRVEIRTQRDVIKGFQVSFDNGKVYHDFSREAIEQALSRFLRPQLAGIVTDAAKKETGNGRGRP